MKRYFAACLSAFLMIGSASADDLEMSKCIGVAVKENGSITFPSPTYANVECYSDLSVNDSRFASILALQELIREFGLDVTMTAMPIIWQVEEDGPEHVAWEVSIYSTETMKVLMVYLIKAETEMIKKICDNRFEDQHCRKLGER